MAAGPLGLLGPRAAQSASNTAAGPATILLPARMVSTAKVWTWKPKTAAPDTVRVSKFTLDIRMLSLRIESTWPIVPYLASSVLHHPVDWARRLRGRSFLIFSKPVPGGGFPNLSDILLNTYLPYYIRLNLNC